MTFDYIDSEYDMSCYFHVILYIYIYILNNIYSYDEYGEYGDFEKRKVK